MEILCGWGLALVAEAARDTATAANEYRKVLARCEATEERHYCLPVLQFAAHRFAVDGSAADLARCAALLADAVERTGQLQARAAFGIRDVASQATIRVAAVAGCAWISSTAWGCRSHAGESETGPARDRPGARCGRQPGRSGGRAAVRDDGGQAAAVPAARRPGRCRPGRTRPSRDGVGTADRAGEGSSRPRRRRPDQRDIAARLFLSVRTVDMHVRNAMGKLGCRTRAEAARRVAVDRYVDHRYPDPICGAGQFAGRQSRRQDLHRPRRFGTASETLRRPTLNEELRLVRVLDLERVLFGCRRERRCPCGRSSSTSAHRSPSRCTAAACRARDRSAARSSHFATLKKVRRSGVTIGGGSPSNPARRGERTSSAKDQRRQRLTSRSLGGRRRNLGHRQASTPPQLLTFAGHASMPGRVHDVEVWLLVVDPLAATVQPCRSRTTPWPLQTIWPRPAPVGRTANDRNGRSVSADAITDHLAMTSPGQPSQGRTRPGRFAVVGRSCTHADNEPSLGEAREWFVERGAKGTTWQHQPKPRTSRSAGRRPRYCWC